MQAKHVGKEIKRMADEISQVVEMEYKGVYYLFKGTKAMIAAMARMVKALQEWKNEKYLKKPGNCTWEKLQEVRNSPKRCLIKSLLERTRMEISSMESLTLISIVRNTI